ncbi:glycosyltransferase, partial [Frankia sp. AvcI1]
MIPVYNEEAVLEKSVRRLHTYLTERYPYEWRITIVDNASTDRTLIVADRLAEELPRVQVRHLDVKGRGLALREAWSASDADIVCYMDVDLST